eukprot:CAMPEP_0178462728 /NCGR_PEP_ID=MMETSP0689_2-20121128/49971_1 /TAXON_ID=160604 /ORGANISM="Amphidinium massartii, Strain CS-259" /LENGTH=94 /DNA_ID=CAMNT_0020089597 /DNA_START=152 /DNA_END=436 /DNA_ORIENTATION=-
MTEGDPAFFQDQAKILQPSSPATSSNCHSPRHNGKTSSRCGCMSAISFQGCSFFARRKCTANRSRKPNSSPHIIIRAPGKVRLATAAAAVFSLK